MCHLGVTASAAPGFGHAHHPLLATMIAVYVHFTVYFSLGLKLHLFRMIRFPSTFRMGVTILWVLGKHFFPQGFNKLFYSPVMFTATYVLQFTDWLGVLMYFFCVIDRMLKHWYWRNVVFPFPPPQPLYKLEEGLVLLIMLFPARAKSILDLSWIFTEAHQTFCQGELPLFW